MKKIKYSLTLAALACALTAAYALKVPAGATGGVITLPDGFKVSVELALTPEEQARGLMYRETIPHEEGMLFIFPEEASRTFWMKNTLADLDMVFLDAGLKTLKVFHRVPKSYSDQPESEVARATGPARMVLELAAGTARAHGVKPGSRLRVSFVSKPQKK